MENIIKNITSKFPEVKSLLDTLQDIKQKERRVKRKLNTKLSEFDFLDKIVGIDMKDKKLTEPLFLYFKHLGLNVHRAPYKDSKGIEDLRLFYKDRLIIIEATSIKQVHAEELKLTQILKHIELRKVNFKKYNVTGLTIINNQDKIELGERLTKTTHNDDTKKILRSHNLTAIYTITLLKDFIKIKNGEITVDDLINNLTSTGIYE